MKFQLRDYQAECVRAVVDSFDDVGSQLVQLPTGSGKTVILWHVLREMNQKAIIIAPSNELTEQITETGSCVVGGDNIYRKTRSYCSTSRQFLVTTTQSAVTTAGRENIARFRPKILVVDEAHRSRAGKLESLIHDCKESGMKILGLTATPERLDGKSLLGVYDKLTFERSLIDLISLGHLVDLTCYRIRTNIRVPKQNTVYGDVAPSTLKLLDNDSRNALIADTYQANLSGKKTLMFCLNVSHARAMAQILTERGVKAKAIYGSMNRPERTEAIAGFRRGDIDVLCNCQLLTEGFDEPSIEALVLARPTKSKALYCQMIGRGVRPYQGKETCLVYDLSDELHDICSFDILGGSGNTRDSSFKNGDRLTKIASSQQPTVDINEIDYSYETFDIYNKNRPAERPAFSHQKQQLDRAGAFYMDDLTVRQAAYILLKTKLLEEYGIDRKAYWSKWKSDL